MAQRASLLTLALVLALAPAAATVPVPRPKPHRDAAATPAMIPVPRPKPRRPASAPPADEGATAWPPAEVAAARSRCASLLGGLDVSYTSLPPIGAPGGCGAPAPLEVSAIAGVTIAPPATLTCEMTAALHGWIAGTLKPQAVKRIGKPITTIHNAASYVCRRRNNQAGGKLSEHARANALDMSGFGFGDGKDAIVGGGWGDSLLGRIGLSAKGSYLDAARQAACASFTTVLGPGSDRFHGDHFHVDVLQRRNDYRICK